MPEVWQRHGDINIGKQINKHRLGRRVLGVFVAVALSIFATFYRIFIVSDYFVDVETVCSPETEAALRGVCDTEDGSWGG